MSRRFLIFVAIVQGIFWIGHAVLWATAVVFFPVDPLWTAIVIGILSVTFTSATLIGHRVHGAWIRMYYKIAAVWVALAHVLLMGSVVAWVALGVVWLAAVGIGPITGESMEIARLAVGSVVLGMALAVALWGLIKARMIKVVRYRVRLPNLPEAWKGRRAVWTSDVHLGYVNRMGFARRLVRKINRMQPDIVFIGGDLFDGTDGELDRLFEPVKGLAAPLGVYFITGNHEEFFNKEQFLAPIRKGKNVRILMNEAVEIDGLWLIGVDYKMTTKPQQYAEILLGLVPKAMAGSTDGRGPVVLLKHDPHHYKIAEEAGVDLQLSGHTHQGQMWPFGYITHKVYEERDYGYARESSLQVITSSGTGTWGPPMRLGTRSEVVEITFT